jgi:uncharacterized protein YdeI (YjbR/CyaY-like superfamily)
MSPVETTPELVVRDTKAWRAWLAKHHVGSSGVFLVLSKKGTTKPTNLTHDGALVEALCYGWIDGQAGPRDETTWRQRFTPRRKRSLWSKRNTVIAEKLIKDGLMHPAGIAEVDRAKADGRWEVAYAGSNIEVPPELTAALAANPKAKKMFDILNSQNRYAVLYRITTAKKAETRAKKIEQFVAMLARGETLYPQKPARSGA